MNLAFFLMSSLLITNVVSVDRATVMDKMNTQAEKRVENREEFKLKLEALRDQRKKAVVERTDKRVASVNEKWTNHWLNVLERLLRLVEKIDSRADKLEDLGKDVSSVREKISSAKSAITIAKSFVVEQAEKDYVFDLGDETVLGEKVRALINEFHADLRGVYQYIDAVRKAVREAFETLKAASASLGNNG